MWGEILGGAQLAMSLAGRAEGQDAAKQAAKQRQAAARFQAEQMRTNALQTEAVGTRAAIAQQRKDDQAILAALAGQRGAPMSPGMMTLFAGLEAQKAYNSASTLYSYQDKARAMRNDAKAVEYSGDASVASASSNTASLIGGLGDIARWGAATFADKYGGGKPTPEVSNDWYNDAEYSGPQIGTGGYEMADGFNGF